jgi:hypothetical protein
MKKESIQTNTWQKHSGKEKQFKMPWFDVYCNNISQCFDSLNFKLNLDEKSFFCILSNLFNHNSQLWLNRNAIILLV